MSQSETEAVTCNRRQARKLRSCKSRLDLVLILIGWESGAILANQPLSEVEQNQSSAFYCIVTYSKASDDRLGLSEAHH